MAINSCPSGVEAMWKSQPLFVEYDALGMRSRYRASLQIVIPAKNGRSRRDDTATAPKRSIICEKLSQSYIVEYIYNAVAVEIGSIVVNDSFGFQEIFLEKYQIGYVS